MSMCKKRFCIALILSAACPLFLMAAEAQHLLSCLYNQLSDAAVSEGYCIAY